MSRLREKGVLVYPAYSRRSGGLSVGINLFPDEKRCSFDCPYCEVFPFSGDAVFSLGRLERDLAELLDWARERGEPVMDVCFSGCGEPTLSPDFPEALKLAARIRDEKAPSSKLVLITNGTGLLEPSLFSLLRDASANPPLLDVWLKLDAGTPGWYRRIDGTAVPAHEKLTAKIKKFAACAPVTIQTMLCAVDGESPPEDEAEAWEKLVVELAAGGGAGGEIRKVQIYGKSRPAPGDPKAMPLPVEYLHGRAAALRRALGEHAGESPLRLPPVEVYP